MAKELVNSIQSLIVISDREKELIGSLFKKEFLAKGQYFLAEGQISRHLGFITKGLVRYYINYNGEEKTYSFSQEKDYVCNYESFIPQRPSSKNIQALEDTDLYVISHEDLQLFYSEVREGERFGRVAVEAIFIQLLQDITSFYIETPELRYERFIKNHADLQQRVSQYHIASYVGVKPQSLSRIRKRISNH